MWRIGNIAYGTWAPLAKYPIVDVASKLARSIRHGSWRGERTRCTLDVSVCISRVPRTYGIGVGDSRLGEYGTWNIGFWVYARQFSRRAENINFDVSPFMRVKGWGRRGAFRATTMEFLQKSICSYLNRYEAECTIKSHGIPIDIVSISSRYLGHLIYAITRLAISWICAWSKLFDLNLRHFFKNKYVSASLRNFICTRK